jgi:hypothetical protein
MTSTPNSECGGIVKDDGLNEILSLSTISCSLLISTGFFIGFSIVIILEATYLVIAESSIYCIRSGGETVRLI